MTTGKELGIEGLRNFMGKKVEITYFDGNNRYPPSRFMEGTLQKTGVITHIADEQRWPPAVAFIELDGEIGTCVFEDTDISEIGPSWIRRLIQGIRR